MSKLYTVIKVARFYWDAVTPYQVHSPFFYAFIKEVAFNNKHYYIFDKIEHLKNHLKQNDELIEVKDFGAGSKVNDSNKRSISSILTSAAIPHNKAKVLFHLVRHFGCKQILELGTNLGIGTSYLASPSSQSHVTSIEGCPNIFKLATHNLNQFGFNNIRLINDEFSNAIENLVSENAVFDLIFIDGNHSYDATWKYYSLLKSCHSNNAIIVIDDIFWSKGMNEVWQKIRSQKEVAASIEMFDLGIIMMDKNTPKKHFSLVPYLWKPWKIGLFPK